jgi:hypothetical protein
MEEDTKNINREQFSFVHHRIVRAVKTGDFVSDRMSYIVITGHWRNFFNEHVPNEERSDDSKDRFYEESEQVCDGRIILRWIFGSWMEGGGGGLHGLYLSSSG